MLVRLIVPFLCFYASIILATGTPKVTRHNSDEPAPIEQHYVMTDNKDNNNAHESTEKSKCIEEEKNISQAHTKLHNEDEKNIPTDKTEIEISSENSMQSTIYLEEQIKRKRFNKAIKALLEKQQLKPIKQLNVPASVFCIAFDETEQYFTITANNILTVYDAARGDEIRRIELKKAILTTKFINQNTVRAMYTGDTHAIPNYNQRNLLYFLYRPKKFLYINIDSQMVTKENVTENNIEKLNAEDDLQTPHAAIHINDNNVVDSRVKLTDTNAIGKQSSAPSISGKIIINGSQRCISVTSDPTRLTLFDITDDYAKLKKELTEDESFLEQVLRETGWYQYMHPPVSPTISESENNQYTTTSSETRSASFSFSESSSSSSSSFSSASDSSNSNDNN